MSYSKRVTEYFITMHSKQKTNKFVLPVNIQHMFHLIEFAAWKKSKKK